MKRDSFIFYRSFYEALIELEDKEQLVLHNAIADFSLNFKEPKLFGITKTIFTLIKPNLEANRKKYLNGIKPKNKSKTEAKPKQTESKTEGNVNVDVNDDKDYNENKDKETYRKFKHLSISILEFNKLSDKHGKEKVDDILDDIENFRNNKKYTSLYLTANKWLKREDNNVSANIISANG